MKKVLIAFLLMLCSVYAQKIATGSNSGYALAITTNGNLYAWGNNHYGQLGNNSTTQSSIPVAVDMSGALNGKTITAIATGAAHTVALTSEGKVYCWGFNQYGQLGSKSTSNSSVPIAIDMSGVLNGKIISAIAAGETHTVALTSEGKVYCWGNKQYGRLGNNSFSSGSVLVPVAVDTSGVLNGKIITDIAAGKAHTVALTSEGKVYCWGVNQYGQLGNNSFSYSAVPVAVDMSGILKGKTVTAISAGGNHTVALTSEGKVYCWGSYSQLGNSSITNGNVIPNNSAIPVAVDINGVLKGKIITDIAAGEAHTVALTSEGKVYCWGFNESGESGNNSGNSQVPVAVDMSGVLNGETVTAVAAGFQLTVTLTSNGKVYSWGNNTCGQLGNGALISSSVPVEVYNLNLLGVEDNNFTVKPNNFALLQNYPNPFNPSTAIIYALPTTSNVKLQIFDILGKEVATLVNENQNSGSHNITFDTQKYGLASGMYFARLQAGSFSKTIKMMLMK